MPDARTPGDPVPPEVEGQLRVLMIRFPGWRFWYGKTSGRVFAIPPPEHPEQELIEADNPVDLAVAVAAAEGRYGPR